VAIAGLGLRPQSGAVHPAAATERAGTPQSGQWVVMAPDAPQDCRSLDRRTDVSRSAPILRRYCHTTPFRRTSRSDPRPRPFPPAPGNPQRGSSTRQGSRSALRRTSSGRNRWSIRVPPARHELRVLRATLRSHFARDATVAFQIRMHHTPTSSVALKMTRVRLNLEAASAAFAGKLIPSHHTTSSTIAARSVGLTRRAA
jgi:hypothetical protein